MVELLQEDLEIEVVVPPVSGPVEDSSYSAIIDILRSILMVIPFGHFHSIDAFVMVLL